MKVDAYDLPEGRVVLQWPDKLDTITVDELEEWLGLIVRKMRRQAITDAAKKEG